MREKCNSILVDSCIDSDMQSYAVRDLLLELNALPEAVLSITLCNIKDEVGIIAIRMPKNCVLNIVLIILESFSDFIS
jgi:hypothetical protein